ncbi:MAG: LPS export ABC transporter periplasmic protein LptC, partial [Gammaproteobacteria bacterium]|nr:LPS export ABC transporter periplasmic protein LptC [Gammaproteobacteria bacterium]
MIYRVMVVLALLTLVVGMVLLSGPRPEPGAPAARGAPLHDPGYSARSARLVQTGADGRPVYTLDAAQIQQQPDTGIVDLTQVRLTFRDTSNDEWTAQAARGELAQQSGIVQLAGDVHV